MMGVGHSRQSGLESPPHTRSETGRVGESLFSSLRQDSRSARSYAEEYM